MTHFGKYVGEEFCVTLLQENLNTAYKLGALEKKQMQRVVADATVQPKSITHPTDTKLYFKGIVKLANLAKKNNVALRQSYISVGKKLLTKACRYRHAKQMKHAKSVEKKLKTRF